MAPKNEQLEYIQNPGFEGGVFKLGRNYFFKGIIKLSVFLSISSIFSIVKQLSQVSTPKSPRSDRSEAKNPWRNRCFSNSHGLLGRWICPSLGFGIQEEPLNNTCRIIMMIM